MWYPTLIRGAVWSLLPIILMSHGSSAATLKRITRQVVQDEYDFIICGGGTAGLVVANQLSESGNQRVLVLEEGPEPSVVAAYETPGGNQFLKGTAIDWAFLTVPQEHLGGRILSYLRGRGLGGSSAINGFYYARGSASIYDKWVELGNPGWGWEDVYPLFNTHFNPPNANRGFDQSFQTWEPSAYSDGPLEIGFQGFVPDSSIAFIRACAEAANIPIVDDLNTGNGTGVKQGTATIDATYRRSSSYDAFYKKRAAYRPNLNVLHSARVSQILTENSTATGVVFIDQKTSLLHSVTARKEVILSSGAFQSPQLLMLSGIGPSAELAKFGISPVRINENIGQHLNDHSAFSIMATVAPESSTAQMSANFASIQEAQAEFYGNLSGPYTAPSGITNGFQMLSNAELESIGAQEVIAQNLTNQSHIEYLYESIFYPAGPTPFYIPRANESYISLTASGLVALSRGNVTLKSSSVADLPIINPNYYAHPTDGIMAIHAFRYLRKILAHPALSALTVGEQNGEVSPGASVRDDDDAAILEYVRANTIPNWHASGTVQMLPEADGGVVDARLRVYGVDRLRVVDCSIIPLLPDVNIQATVFMVGLKGGIVIREDWGDL